MESVRFMVDDRPFACSDWNLRDKNLEFLRGVDSEYFAYVATAHLGQFEGGNKVHASIAVRTAYSQALEALFAFLCAAIQAPQCVVGWMLAYRPEDLLGVVSKVTNSASIYSRVRSGTVNWHQIAAFVHAHVGFDKEKATWIQKGFGDLWSRLAHELLDERSTQEYNAIKHGFRTRLGGFTLSVGKEPSPGIAPPTGEMMALGGSEYGTSYFVQERIGGNKINFRPRRNARNWHPRNLVNGLSLMAMSIQNVVGCLRIANGDAPDKCMFSTPDRKEAFDAPWEMSVGVNWLNMDKSVLQKDVMLYKKEDVIASYSNAS